MALFALYLARGLPVAIIAVQDTRIMSRIPKRPTLSHFSASRSGAIRSIALRAYFTTTCEVMSVKTTNFAEIAKLLVVAVQLQR